MNFWDKLNPFEKETPKEFDASKELTPQMRENNPQPVNTNFNFNTGQMNNPFVAPVVTPNLTPEEQKKWTDFYLQRDIDKEKELFDTLGVKEKEYIFINEDSKRGFFFNKDSANASRALSCLINP